MKGMKRVMFSKLKVLSVLALILLAGCIQEKGGEERSPASSVLESETPSQEPVKPQDTETVTGVAVGGAHASIEIEDAQGESHEFSYPDIDPSRYDTWEEGDTMVVTFIHNDNPEIGDSVVSIKQKNPAKGDNF